MTGSGPWWSSFVPACFAPLGGEVAVGAVKGPGHIEDVLLAWKISTICKVLGRCSAAKFQIHEAPSPSTTRRWARSTPRRCSSRTTRAANGDGSRSMSRLAMLSMAASQDAEPGSRHGWPCASCRSADQTVTRFTSRALALPSACLRDVPAQRLGMALYLPGAGLHFTPASSRSSVAARSKLVSAPASPTMHRTAEDSERTAVSSAWSWLVFESCKQCARKDVEARKKSLRSCPVD